MKAPTKRELERLAVEALGKAEEATRLRGEAEAQQPETDPRARCINLLENQHLANERLRAEVARLEAVLRETHTNYCCTAYTDRNMHAPECLLYEIEDDRVQGPEKLGGNSAEAQRKSYFRSYNAEDIAAARARGRAEAWAEMTPCPDCAQARLDEQHDVCQRHALAKSERAEAMLKQAHARGVIAGLEIALSCCPRKNSTTQRYAEDEIQAEIKKRKAAQACDLEAGHDGPHATTELAVECARLRAEVEALRAIASAAEVAIDLCVAQDEGDAIEIQHLRAALDAAKDLCEKHGSLADLFSPEKTFSDAPGNYNDPALREAAQRMTDAWNGRYPDPAEVRRALTRKSGGYTATDFWLYIAAAEAWLKERE